jgi:murein DD-endopeptidase MepM/ murein hydrolase activator NlpD
VAAFCKPFSGEYSTADFFDHDLPFEFTDNNGYQLTWWGLKVWPTIDGHSGYDWSMPEGTPVLAVAPGKVVLAGVAGPFPCPLFGGREVSPNMVIIEHQVSGPTGPLRVRSLYNHLSQVGVQVGQQVAQGDQVGLSGNTGCSGGPHLHFQTNLSVNGRFVPIDPYGWEGSGPDPWAQDPRGAQSFWFWEDGQAPAISYLDRTLAPNCATPTPCATPGGNAPAPITYVRWLATHDDQNPNNEFVELTLDPHFAPSGTFDLSRYTMRDNQGDTFTFPDGFRIQQGATVRVYVGTGQNTATELYWGRSSGAFNPMGDCVRLQAPNTPGAYRVATPGGSCA